MNNIELSDKEKMLLDRFAKLNEYGQNNLLEFADDLLAAPYYTEEKIIPFNTAKRMKSRAK